MCALLKNFAPQSTLLNNAHLILLWKAFQHAFQLRNLDRMWNKEPALHNIFSIEFELTRFGSSFSLEGIDFFGECWAVGKLQIWMQ